MKAVLKGVLVVLSFPFVLLGMIYLPALFGDEVPLCHNSNPDFLWYTKNGQCSAVIASSCKFGIYNSIPWGTTAGCADEQKLLYLENYMTEFLPLETKCKRSLDSNPDDWRSAASFDWIFYAEEMTVKICQPYISATAYEKAMNRFQDSKK